MPSPSPVISHRRATQIATATGWVLIAIALSVLCVWAFQSYLSSNFSSWPMAMKANTAIAFLLAGFAILRRSQHDLPFYSLAVLAIGTLTLTEYLWHFDLGIDQVLFEDPYSAISPGRMSQITCMAFIFLGPSLTLMNARSAITRRVSRGLGLISGALGFLALLGYSYDTQALYRVRPHSGLALHTAVAFVVAAIGVQYANPEEGLLRNVHADNAGGVMLRRLLPVAILIPYALGFATWVAHEHLGWELGFSVALLVAGTMLCLVLIIFFHAKRSELEEISLRESEERYRHLVESSNDWVWEVDAEATYTYASPRCRDILGYEPAELIGKKPFDLMPPEEARRVDAAFKAIAAERKAFRALQNVNLHKDGHLVILETNGIPVLDPHGIFRGYRGMDRDVTTRYETERALRESEKRFRRVVEHIGDAIFVDDREGHIVFANDRFLDLFGFGRDELQNVKIEDYVSSEYHAELRDRHNRRICGEAVPNHFEYQGIRRDGGRIWLEVDVVPVKDEAGNVVGTQSALRNITERKRAEEALQESEERFRLVANTAPVMIWMAGPDKLCTYFNQRWLEFTGRPLGSELGHDWTEGLHPEDLKVSVEAYRRAFDRRDPFRMQYRLRRYDGEYRWLVNIGVPRFNPNGSFAGYIGSCLDVTDRKLAEEALAGIGRRLIEAQEEERTRIARELHDDINQRIALLAIDLGSWDKDLGQSESKVHDHIVQLRDRLSEIAKDVQALSHRLHSSKLEYLGIAVAASSFCREIAERQNAVIDFHHSGALQKIPNEISLCLFRVLQEALQNAVKHSGVRNFSVDLKGKADEIELTVRDLGAGFDAQRVAQSHGLGLISMRERLHLVHGDLAIQSTPGRGTTVRARVPLRNQGAVSDHAEVA